MKLNFEFQRKIFHFSSIIIPISYLVIPELWMSILLFIITVGVITLDISRIYNKNIDIIIKKYMHSIIRPEEYNKLGGSSFMALGFLITVICFDKYIAITSWFVLAISDGLAAMIGTKYGKTKILESKTLEGTIAFFVSSAVISIVSYLSFNIDIKLGRILLICMMTSIVELFSKSLNTNDNLSIPVSYCLFSVAASLI